MTLEKNSAKPLYLQLEERLRNQIETGQLAPGARVPSELELAAAYNISRMTARKATDALVAEGILVRRAGKGTFVAKDKMPFPAATLSSFSSTMRILGLTVTSKVLKLELVKPPPKVVKELTIAPGQQVVFLKRLRFIDNEPMAVMSSYMPASFYTALLAEDLTARPLTQIMERASGLRIVSSRDHIEASVARPEEAALLDIRKGAPVLLGRGVIYESGGAAVRSSTVVYRGDRFRISLSAEHGAGTEVKLPEREQTVTEHHGQWLTLGFNLAE